MLSICVIAENPAKISTPFMKDVLHLLGMKHVIRLMIVPVMPGIKTTERTLEEPLADVYLLKSHLPRALEVARQLEERGALMINSWRATLSCQDRVLMSKSLSAAGVPWPRTWHLDRFERELNDALLKELTFPVIVKSRYAYESESVDRVESAEQLKRLALYWSREPVIIQECLTGDGWDTKVWVIDGQMFAAKRRSPLDDKPGDQFQISLEELGEDVQRITLQVGRVFGLQVYDVDFLMTEHGPVVIDVNSFPGFRGLFGPEKALADFVDHICEQKRAGTTIALSQASNQDSALAL